MKYMIQRLLSSQNARAFSISSASQSRCSEPLPLSRRSVSHAFSSAPRLRRANPDNLPLSYYARLYGRVRRRPASVLPSTFEPQTQMASLGGEGERGGERQEEGGIDDAKSLMRRAESSKQKRESPPCGEGSRSLSESRAASPRHVGAISAPSQRRLPRREPRRLLELALELSEASVATGVPGASVFSLMMVSSGMSRKPMPRVPPSV